MSTTNDAPGTWIIDLDGVLWLSGQAIPGSAEAVVRLRQAGIPVLFATNNAEPTMAELIRRLAAIGVEADPSELVTSGQAAATLVEPGQRVLACGGPGLVEALQATAATVVDQSPADAVVVGMTRAFDYELLTRTALAVRAGARLIGTNEDPTHPTPEGLFPGSGALVAAVETAAQQPAIYAGKPHEPMARLIAERAPRRQWVVGDRPATDGMLARRLGMPFALVLSGVTSAGDAAGPSRPGRGGPTRQVGTDDASPTAAAEAPDLATLVDRWLARLA